VHSKQHVNKVKENTQLEKATNSISSNGKQGTGIIPGSSVEDDDEGRSQELFGE
jgi:hypothetical protein